MSIFNSLLTLIQTDWSFSPSSSQILSNIVYKIKPFFFIKISNFYSICHIWKCWNQARPIESYIIVAMLSVIAFKPHILYKMWEATFFGNAPKISLIVSIVKVATSIPSPIGCFVGASRIFPSARWTRYK